MDFVTIEELAQAVNQSRRTVDRKLKGLQKFDPDKYDSLIHREGKKITYNPEGIIGYLKSGVTLTEMPSTEEMLQRPEVIPKPIKDSFKRLKKGKKKKIVSNRERTEKLKQEISQELESEPEIIAMDAENQLLFKGLTLEEQKNFIIFSKAMFEYESGLYTRAECLISNGITERQFYRWRLKKAFAIAYAKSDIKHRTAFNTRLTEGAKEGLLKILTGYDNQMETIIYQQKVSVTGQTINIPVEKRVQTKHVTPNATAISLVLTNRESDLWKRVFLPAIGGSATDRQQDPLEAMSDEQLWSIVEMARNQGLLNDSAQV